MECGTKLWGVAILQVLMGFFSYLRGLALSAKKPLCAKWPGASLACFLAVVFSICEFAPHIKWKLCWPEDRSLTCAFVLLKKVFYLTASQGIKLTAHDPHESNGNQNCFD